MDERWRATFRAVFEKYDKQNDTIIKTLERQDVLTQMLIKFMDDARQNR